MNMEDIQKVRLFLFAERNALGRANCYANTGFHGQADFWRGEAERAAEKAEQIFASFIAGTPMAESVR